VAVLPLPANDPPASATASPTLLVAMRDGAPVRAGAHPEDADDLVTPWHHHDMHQILYAFEGVAEVETPSSRHLLPPQQAAWIPAGLQHRTTLRRVRSGAVFFEPSMVPGRDERVRVLTAIPVLREMVAYAMRWSVTRPNNDATSDTFFSALALLATEWLDSEEAPLGLPTSTVPVIRDVMAFTQERLVDVTAPAVCAAVGISERSLRRRFPRATGMTWQEYRRASRVLRAMAMLAEGDRTVLDTATAVGFDSPSAFNRAFRALTGELPSTYRRRIRSREVRPG
jgi:AraC-like DNA-binding protein